MQKPRRACRIREAEDSRGGTSNSITDREKAFVAGADICKFHSESEGEGLRKVKKNYLIIENRLQTSIAAVNGLHGGGLR
jgi:enoyl-CoA hydratase/carnithine racemase